MPDFKQFLAELVPSWLLEGHGGTLLRTVGDATDEQVERALAVVKARFPRYAPDDGLAMTGRERQIPRVQGESAAQYAARLEGAWNSWPKAGTAHGILLALADAGYPTAQLCIVLGYRYSLGPVPAGGGPRPLVVSELAPGGWAFEPNPRPFWSRFVLLFTHEAGFPAHWQVTEETAGGGLKYTAQLGARVAVREEASTGAPVLSVLGTVKADTARTWEVKVWGDGTFSYGMPEFIQDGGGSMYDPAHEVGGVWLIPLVPDLRVQWSEGDPYETDEEWSVDVSIVDGVPVAGPVTTPDGQTSGGIPPIFHVAPGASVALEGRWKVIVVDTSPDWSFYWIHERLHTETEPRSVYPVPLRLPDGSLSGLAVEWPAGTYNPPATWQWPVTVTSEVVPATVVDATLDPAEDSEEMGLIRRIVHAWNYAGATFHSICIVTHGRAFDWPNETFDEWAAAADLSGNVTIVYHP